MTVLLIVQIIAFVLETFFLFILSFIYLIWIMCVLVSLTCFSLLKLKIHSHIREKLLINQVIQDYLNLLVIQNIKLFSKEQMIFYIPGFIFNFLLYNFSPFYLYFIEFNYSVLCISLLRKLPIYCLNIFLWSEISNFKSIVCLYVYLFFVFSFIFDYTKKRTGCTCKWICAINDLIPNKDENKPF